MVLKYIKPIALLGTIGTGTYFHHEIKQTGVGGVRLGRAALTVSNIVLDYKKTFKNIHNNSVDAEKSISETHQKSAEKLLDLCCKNGGVFIKVGQHIGSLDYLLPAEYVSTLKILHNGAPKSKLEDIYGVIKAELKQDVSEIFVKFDEEPLGAASLAQVHKAVLKDGTTVAVKVQHPTVLENTRIDTIGMEALVNLVSKIFPEFQFQWLVNEMKRNLPLETDFVHEGKNCEKVENMFSHFKWLKVPKIHWDLTTKRVMTMEYCEGGQVNDLEYVKKNKINVHEVARNLGELYSEMIFVHGYIHCDPHPGNVFLRKNGSHTDIILLDHGLYLDLTNDFRLLYGSLWQAVLNANVNKILDIGRTKLGLGDLSPLFTCMVTGRTWDSISKGIETKRISCEEQQQTKEDAAKFAPEIATVLCKVPREMLLIFKTNDLLRGIEFTLKTHQRMDSFISMARSCIRAIYSNERKYCDSLWCYYKYNLAEFYYNLKISFYSLYLWFFSLYL